MRSGARAVRRAGAATGHLMDHTEVLGNRVRVGLERDGVAHVQQLSMHARTECRDLVGRLPQADGIDVRHGDACFAARELQRARAADARAGARDDTLGFLATAFYAVASAEPMRMTGTLRSTE